MAAWGGGGVSNKFQMYFMWENKGHRSVRLWVPRVYSQKVVSTTMHLDKITFALIA